jgi:hypothetical protein
MLPVIVIAAALVDLQHRRLRRRMDGIDRFIDNMDRWADTIEDRLEQSERRAGPRLHDFHANSNATGRRSRYYYS